MSSPSILIVSAAAKAMAEATIAAVISERYSFTRGLIPTDTQDPTDQSEPTHYLACDMSMSDERTTIFDGLMTGALPEMPNEGQMWGTDGLPGRAEALAAVSHTSLQLYPVPDTVAPYDTCNSIITERGLVFVPGPAP